MRLIERVTQEIETAGFETAGFELAKKGTEALWRVDA